MKTHAVAEGGVSGTAVRSHSVSRPTQARLIQTKLAVGASDDAYEHEADRAADAAVHSSRTAPARPIAQEVTPLVQRVPLNQARKDLDDDHKPLQKKEASASSTAPVAEQKEDEHKPLQKKKASASSIASMSEHKEDEHKPLQKKEASTSSMAPMAEQKEDEHKPLQKKEASNSALESQGVPHTVERQIEQMSGGGDSLPQTERAFFENRFGYDFRDVRVHTGSDAAQASTALNARAFTVGQHIYFGGGEYQPASTTGRHLMAHELTHTIQQAPPAAQAARRLQRGLLDSGKEWVLDKVRELAVEMPGYRLMTVILKRDPITDKGVERSAENVIHGILDLVPEGETIFQHLQESKELQQFADYFDQQVTQLDLSWDTVKALFAQAWDKLDLSDLAAPRDAWDKLKSVFGPPLLRLKTFATNIGGYILASIKKHTLGWLKDWATQLRGYPLLTFILGKDPFTDEEVPRTPTAFIKAVLNLVNGGDKIFENLQKAHTIERTSEWLNQEILKLDLSWEKIKALFRRAWDVINIGDLLHPLEFVAKIRDIFEAPAIRVVNFALAVGKKVLEFIFEGVMLLAGPMGQRIATLFKKASATFSLIVADPVAFLGHLLDAVKLGFQQFVGKIGQYMIEGVIGWLTSSLEGAGITLPKVWDFKGVLSLVLQILGITYEKMRAKFVKVLGEERVAQIEKVSKFLIGLATEGPAYLWKQITDAIGNFWNMVIGGIKDWAIVKIIKVAVTELVALFNPVGAVVEAVIEIYRTVEFFVKKINQILSLVEAIVDSIANIAAGKIGAAANYVEKTLARTLPVIIGFLASLVGLDDVSEGIRSAIEALQEKVDEAIDTAIDWVVTQVKSLFGNDEEDEEGEGEHDAKWDAAVEGVKADVAAMKEVTPEAVEEKIPEWKTTYGFSELQVEISSDSTTATIDGAMSPSKEVMTFPINLPDSLKALPPGKRYKFSGKDPDNPARGELKKYVDMKVPDAKAPRWFAFYELPKGGLQGVPAFKEGTEEVAIEEDPTPVSNIKPLATEPGRAALGGNKSKTVRGEGLQRQEGEAPDDPYAWKRLKDPGKNGYARGHLIAKMFGGKGDYWNVAPIPQVGTNLKMLAGHENKIRAGMDNEGKYFWAEVEVEYQSDDPSSPVKFLADFPEKISVEYGEWENQSGTWGEKAGTEVKGISYDVPAPDISVIEPAYNN